MGEQMSDESVAPDTGNDKEPPASEAQTAAQPAPDTGDDKDWKSEAQKWQAQAKKHEREWKKFSKDLDEARQAQMSETEKAVAEAEARGRKAATVDVGQRLAAAEIKAALTGVVPDPAGIAEDLNLTKYITDDGEVDLDAVAALKAKYEALRPSADTTSAPPGQRPKEDLPSVPLPNSKDIQIDDERDPRVLAKRIRRV